MAMTVRPYCSHKFNKNSKLTIGEVSLNLKQTVQRY